MKKNVVFMFPGQGSQYYGMGKELYHNNPRFKLWMDHCDELVSPLIGSSFVDELYQAGKNRAVPFSDIHYTNPAIFCFEYSLARVLMEMGIHPDYLLGYSLGELTASVVSGAILLEDAIEFVVDYGKILKSDAKPGAMLAIVEPQDIVTKFPELFAKCSMTGRHFDKNFVMAGSVEDVLDLQKKLNEKHFVSQLLAVDYAFHTSLLEPLENPFRNLCQSIDFHPMTIPIVSSVKPGQIFEVNENHLWNVSRNIVDFETTIADMLEEGDYIFVDVGADGSLATFVKYLLPEASKSLQTDVINPFGNDLASLERLREMCVREGVSPALIR
jgi:bacillaene synthase trans-acting acyltransferase